MRNNKTGSDAYFFNRSWAEFRQGFGNSNSFYWIGLDRLHDLTQSNCSVRFDLQEKWSLNWYFATYTYFRVGALSTNFTLSISGFTGNFQDAMFAHSGIQFSTFDNNHNPLENTAKNIGGGFWHKNGCCGDPSCCPLCCSEAFITVSPSANLYWYTSSTSLNACQVRLMC